MSIHIRDYPYPYRSMLAICSDLDETPDKHVYFESIRYLNSEEETIMGRGVGLEVGNTMYFDMPKEQFSYWNTDDGGRAVIRRLMRSGHIDCLHSFGDLASTRAHVERAWAELEQNNCWLNVWIDHASALTNFDNEIMLGEGANKESDVYHADLSLAKGIEFVWKGRVSSIVAQNAKRQYSGIANFTYPVDSVKTITKEFLKGVLGFFGKKKYAMHWHNNVLGKSKLNSGQSVYEFMRTNPSWAGVSVFETARGVHNVLTTRMLDQLVRARGCSVMYTHLGKVENRDEPFSPKARQSFQLLKQYEKNGLVLVTTTRRLLGFCRTMNELSYVVDEAGECVSISVTTNYEGSDLQGLGWYVPKDKEVKLYVNGSLFSDVVRNEPDETGRFSISIPWQRLSLPRI